MAEPRANQRSTRRGLRRNAATQPTKEESGRHATTDERTGRVARGGLDAKWVRKRDSRERPALYSPRSRAMAPIREAMKAGLACANINGFIETEKVLTDAMALLEPASGAQ